MIEKLGPEIFLREPRLPGTPTLPRHFNEPPIFYHRKSLSYSELDLRRLGSELNLLTESLMSLSQTNVGKPIAAPKNTWNSNTFPTSYGSTNSLWEIKNAEYQRDGSILLKKVKQKSIQRSESVGNHTYEKRSGQLSKWKAELSEEFSANGKKPESKEEEYSEVPFITLQSELSLDARRLLVAQALAVDLFLDGEEVHRSKVLSWQVNGQLRNNCDLFC